ncbi:MAG TPA: hypothetical protein VHM27_10255 [Rhizomicrobium sp.]|jgi:hypothetical protein|nr:hypothetical protein [Rhizomicrobium sp.]
MIYEALGAAALGAIVLGAAALIPGLGGVLRKVGYATGVVLIIAGAGLFFWPAETPPQVAADGQATEVKLTIPPPSGELAKFTSDELVEGANVLAQVIADYGQANQSAAQQAKQKYYTDRFAKPVADMTAELNARIVGGISFPDPDPYLIGNGAMVAVSGKLTGTEPFAAVSNFLRYTALQVPTIAKAP